MSRIHVYGIPRIDAIDVESAPLNCKTNPTIGFTGTLTQLGGAPATCATATGATSTTACLIDDFLAQGTKSGYNFAVGGTSGTPAVTYTSSATPVAPGQSGQRYFCSDQSGVIYFNLAAVCTSANGTPL